MPDIVITDLHHEVLAAWAACRGHAGIPLQVLSLDFHTDVLNCARRNIPFPVNAAEAVNVLHHDEHFDWALRAKIISRAVIIALSPCAVPPEHPALEVRRSGSLPDMESMLNDAAEFRPVARMVLDDRFLVPLLADGFPDEPYIQDIDCDYIMCREALEPEQSSFLRRLMHGAQLITLSREEAWVKILKLPGENLDSAEITGKLRTFC